jgi:hypothetical protein
MIICAALFVDIIVSLQRRRKRLVEQKYAPKAEQKYSSELFAGWQPRIEIPAPERKNAFGKLVKNTVTEVYEKICNITNLPSDVQDALQNIESRIKEKLRQRELNRLKERVIVLKNKGISKKNFSIPLLARKVAINLVVAKNALHQSLIIFKSRINEKLYRIRANRIEHKHLLLHKKLRAIRSEIEQIKSAEFSKGKRAVKNE